MEIVELLREPELRTRHSIPRTQSIAVVHQVGTGRELWLLRKGRVLIQGSEGRADAHQRPRRDGHRQAAVRIAFKRRRCLVPDELKGGELMVRRVILNDSPHL